MGKSYRYHAWVHGFYLATNLENSSENKILEENDCFKYDIIEKLLKIVFPNQMIAVFNFLLWSNPFSFGEGYNVYNPLLATETKSWYLLLQVFILPVLRLRI